MTSTGNSGHRVHPVTAALLAQRTESVQLKIADGITPFAGSMATFVLIGQNRQAAFQQAKADHDFVESELERKANTELTRQIHTLTTELHRRLVPEGNK